MSLKLVSLTSGSKGNCTLVFSNTTAILVDAGLSYTRLCTELKDFGLTPDMIDGVVITHEHSDHICGLPKLAPHTKSVRASAHAKSDIPAHGRAQKRAGRGRLRRRF
ncbi:MAG: MBL fold metallo-hydrolase [Christensenella sp.]|nr:MAG: MBL fold metallo-hydrolase [Christensenella sp.]